MPPKAKRPATSKTQSQRKPASFALVRWLSDESVGVMPLSATDDKEVHAGSITMMAWKGRNYQAEILKISG